METMTYALNTGTPAGEYQIMITSSGVMLWAVTIKRGWAFLGGLLGVRYNQTFILQQLLCSYLAMSSWCRNRQPIEINQTVRDVQKSASLLGSKGLILCNSVCLRPLYAGDRLRQSPKTPVSISGSDNGWMDGTLCVAGCFEFILSILRNTYNWHWHCWVLPSWVLNPPHWAEPNYRDYGWPRPQHLPYIGWGWFINPLSIRAEGLRPWWIRGDEDKTYDAKHNFKAHARGPCY